MARIGMQYVSFVTGRGLPLDLRGKEQNMVIFTKTLLEEIAKEEGFQVEIIQVGSSGLYDGLDQGSFDAPGWISCLTKIPQEKSKKTRNPKYNNE